MTSEIQIPFNRPFIAGKELYYISQAVLSGQLAGDGKYTKLCQQWMEERFEAKKVLLTHSCTAALEMTVILAEIEPGDEVIMPSYTFVSTANAFALRGAKIRFVDIREDTLNLDESLVEEAITERTKAIVGVHYAGVGCEMDTLWEITKRHNLILIEDAAQGVFATYKGKYLGTIGHMGTYSFHETKNFITGEGGALVLNEEQFFERAEIIREKGTNRSKFFRGEVDKYTWVDVGSSYLPSEIIAAFLYAQLEEADEVTQRRQKIFDTYLDVFQPLEEEGILRVPHWPAECKHNAHMFYLKLNIGAERDALIDHLKSEGVHSVFHYIPLHSSPMGQQVCTIKEVLPVTDQTSSRLVRLPFYYEMSSEDQEHVIGSCLRFFQKIGAI